MPRITSLINLFITCGKLIKQKAYIWLPHYLRRKATPLSDSKTKHIIVLVTDHFEPSRREGKLGEEKVEEWCNRYRNISEQHQDSYGNTPQHTWFYRYDYPNETCLYSLNKMVFAGFGEIEFHLHHGYDSEASFHRYISDGLTWFNNFGAMISMGKTPVKHFAYIAGNWALDNGLMDPSTSGCDTEIKVLGELGCYADFTFPALGMVSQPQLSNTIFYAIEDGKARSHKNGPVVSSLTKNSGDLMIFQGPLHVDWCKRNIEYASIEYFTPFNNNRINYWLNANIHIEGKPEWVFFKLHTHGMQSMESFLGEEFEQRLNALESTFKKGNYRLHYVTARQAYNIVKAAESGCNGNPNEFLDYIVKPPTNRSICCNRQYRLTQPTTHIMELTFNNQDSSGEVQINHSGVHISIYSAAISILINFDSLPTSIELDIQGEGSALIKCHKSQFTEIERTLPYSGLIHLENHE